MHRIALVMLLLLVNCSANTFPLSNGSTDNLLRLVQDKPPLKNCKKECVTMEKCTPGPCKRVGDTMKCEPERCVPFQQCNWVCPP
jgi:hypothetical protein